MRIMQLYRIESDYKNHRKRLESIKHGDSKQKIKRITSQQFYVANELKKIKLQDQGFQQKEEKNRREHTQQLMNKTINDQFKRIRSQYEVCPPVAFSNHKTIRHSPRNCEQQQSNNEFSYMKHKIDNMKSVYKKMRKNSEIQGSGKSERERGKRSEKEVITDLLKHQFKIEPKVVFPRCKAKTIVLDASMMQSEAGGGSKREALQSMGSVQKF